MPRVNDHVSFETCYGKARLDRRQAKVASSKSEDHPVL